MSDERPPFCHNLKCWPTSFAAIADGDKTLELRVDDRDEGYEVGDFLLLQEFDPSDYPGGSTYAGYSGSYALVEVTHILRPEDVFGGFLKDCVAMSIRLVKASDE